MLKKIEHLKNIECPYKFFASLYHIAFPKEGYLIQLDNNHENPFIVTLQNVEVRDGKGHFALPKKVPWDEIRTDKKAGLLIIALLAKMDRYFTGVKDGVGSGAEDHESQATADPFERILNPCFYQPIEVKFGKERASYIIAPNIEPLFKREKWTTNSTRGREYFHPNISTRFVINHTLIKNGAVNSYPVEIANSDKSLVKNITELNETLRNMKKLTLGIAPYDSGFEFEYETNGKGQKGQF